VHTVATWQIQVNHALCAGDAAPCQLLRPLIVFVTCWWVWYHVFYV